MEYQKLGLTDLNISRIGFGCWAIGGHGYGRISERDFIKAVKKALDLGVNFFDTADVYGFGRSESVLAKVLGSKKNQVIITTKFGVAWDKNGKTYKDCSPGRVEEALEGSLRRLKIDCIPLYQIHWHDGVTPISETMHALVKYQKAGKIKYIGCSNFDYELIVKASKTKRIESLQTLYNIIDRNSEDKIKKCSLILNMGIIVYGVLGRGLFSGKYSLRNKFPENDTRDRIKSINRDEFRASIILAKELNKVGKNYGKTASQVAIRWVLDNPKITCALVGIKNLKQAKENTDVFSWRLSRRDRDYINSIAC